jgi:hypothetical protein
VSGTWLDQEVVLLTFMTETMLSLLQSMVVLTQIIPIEAKSAGVPRKFSLPHLDLWHSEQGLLLVML